MCVIKLISVSLISITGPYMYKNIYVDTVDICIGGESLIYICLEFRIGGRAIYGIYIFREAI